MPFLAFRSSTFRYLLIDQTAKAAQMSAMYCVQYKYSASCTTRRKVGPFWSPFFSKSSLGSHLPRYLLLANKSYHSKDLDVRDQQKQNFQRQNKREICIIANQQLIQFGHYQCLFSNFISLIMTKKFHLSETSKYLVLLRSNFRKGLQTLDT